MSRGLSAWTSNRAKQRFRPVGGPVEALGVSYFCHSNLNLDHMNVSPRSPRNPPLPLCRTASRQRSSRLVGLSCHKATRRLARLSRPEPAKEACKHTAWRASIAAPLRLLFPPISQRTVCVKLACADAIWGGSCLSVPERGDGAVEVGGQEVKVDWGAGSPDTPLRPEVND